MTVTVITPTLPRRIQMLRRAQRSVRLQTYPSRHLVIPDRQAEGPSVIRNRGAEEAATEWIAFLDDDDELYPHHVVKCLQHARDTGADLVYPWFDIKHNGRLRNELGNIYTVGGQHAFGQPWSEQHAADLQSHNFIPVTVLVRRSALLDAGGFVVPNTPEWPHADCEDWGTWRRLLAAGATFSHLGERTWVYHWHGRNSSGRPDKARRLRLI